MPDASATRIARIGLGAKIFIAATLSVAGVLGVTLGLTSLQANRTADESIRRALAGVRRGVRSEEHTSELQLPCNLVCRLLLEKKNTSELQSPCNIVCRLLLEKKNTTDLHQPNKTLCVIQPENTKP